MRKHSARKWLHFVLDLLPILVLPIFAIYEINHDNNEPITVTDGAWEHLALFQTNDVDSVSDLQENNIYYYSNTFENNNGTINTTLSMFVYKADNIAFDTSSIISYDMYNYICTDTPFEFFFDNDTVQWKTHGVYVVLDYLYIENFDFTFVCNDIQQFFIDYNLDIGDILPSTYQQYDYIYNENHIYDNTDIGSQMLYALYKPVKEYFNFNNVFNFGDIYEWFNVNMFNGNAPMPFFIVWNIIVYQFLMDLMFLVYSIFMFIIDFTSECLERCFSFSRHGGSR